MSSPDKPQENIAGFEDLASYVGRTVSVSVVQRKNNFDEPTPVWGVSDRNPNRVTGVLIFDNPGYRVKTPSGSEYLCQDTFHISNPQIED